MALGPQHTEPLDLWWVPMGPWMILTYAILIVGGLLIAWELKLIGLVLGFMVGFAIFTAIAIAPVPDHCMVASWHVTPLCGRDLWQILVTSPEILIFALFMVPDPRTVPDGPLARVVFGVIVAVLAVLLLGPTALEFWTKTAILASLVIACAMRFALVRFLAPFETGLPVPSFGRRGWRVAAFLAVTALLTVSLPVSAALSTHRPAPAAGLADGSTPTVTLKVGTSEQPVASWVTGAAAGALPPAADSGPVSATGRVWNLPPIPSASVASNVSSFDPQITQSVADKMAHDVVLDLIIESEARRSHDLQLAYLGANGDGLTEFTDVIKTDIAAGQIVQKTYSFDAVSIQLFLPKFATQAARLVGVTMHGTATLTTRDASGKVLSQTSSTYGKSWGVGYGKGGPTNQLIFVDYTGLAPAP